MDLIPLTIGTKCVLGDEGLYEHIRLALERGLPLIPECEPHDGVAVLVGSGASVNGQFESIRKQRDELHRRIVAIKDAHDWLIERGIVPDYAVAIDPQEHRWNCFKRKHPDVKYLIASQCHPAMFEHLSGHQVFLWHLYIRAGQTYPPNSILVTGGTTTGLRAMTLFYSLGFRRFELYGYDCCITDGALRFDGLPPQEKVIPVIVGGKTFSCTTAMASQASEFQNLFGCMPDIEVHSHGDGVITTILEERAKFVPLSFIHSGNENMASFRYRAQTPAHELGVPLNNLSAGIVVFAKPVEREFAEALAIKNSGRKIIVDYCDDHFERSEHYKAFLSIADAVTCPTAVMAAQIIAAGYKREITVIPDAYEFPEAPPHCNGTKLLWFGHAVNYYSLDRILSQLDGYQLTVISNVYATEPWSLERMRRGLCDADIVILPATAAHKSANRALEAIRQGCFVVAEPHPALNDFPGIWLGNIREGIEWASQNQNAANDRTQIAQEFIRERFAPRTQASAWKKLLARMKQDSISEAAGTAGQGGSMSMDSTLTPTLGAISGLSTLAMNEQIEHAPSTS